MNLQTKINPPVNAHRYRYRVPYSETDAMGRVYYANYLVWFERSRTEMLRAAGFPYRQMESSGIFLPVRQCAVRYLGFAEYDDEIELLSWIGELRRARVIIATAAKKNEQIITVGEVELACVGANGKPREWRDDILAALQTRLAITIC